MRSRHFEAGGAFDEETAESLKPTSSLPVGPTRLMCSIGAFAAGCPVLKRYLGAVDSRLDR